MSREKQAEPTYRERNSTADKALVILGMFSEERQVITGADVVDQLQVVKSTAYRYIQSLQSSGLIEENPESPGFRLGPRVFELARIARHGLGLSEAAGPILRELAEELQETVLLTRRSETHVICVERYESRTPIRLSYERGQVLPLNAGASALISLAWESDRDIERLLAQAELTRLTERSTDDPAKLHDRLAEIRERGYAVTRGEVDPYVVGVGAPIRGADGTVVAGATVVGLEQRLTQDAIPKVAERVREAAEAVSQRLRVLAS
ncbi:IclR family transcriptional regulator [Streptomyces sp. NPDC017988]|uniref:IclR family transcriptional regulator n=1 Tax=Streptomyces sp. NPDC017988 TaxID=3365025 RepID=UPI00379C5186